MKKILFIAPKFYQYSEEIKKEFKNQGYEIFYIEENKQNFYSKIGIKFFKKNKFIYSDIYFEKNLNKLNQDFDIIFVIRGENISVKIMKLLKQKFEKSRFIMYQWDSLTNLKNYQSIKEYFDKIITFDDYDAKINSLEFQPLFYLTDFKKESNNKLKEYDLYCVSDNHSDRYKILMKIYKDLKNKQKIFFYLKASLIDQIIFMLTTREITPGINLKNCDFVYFKALKKNKNIEFMNKAKAILDIQFIGQNGLTIRTIETLINRSKLITTNKNVVNYDFYHPNNILVIDRENPQIDADFFDKPYVELAQEIYEKYSLTNWVKKVLE